MLLPLLATLATTPAAVSDTFDWKAALEAPLAAGAMAALVEHGDDPAVQERWRAGLRAPSAEVRAAAARAVYAAGAKALAPAVKEVLASEESVEAATEQIRTLLALGTVVDDDAVIEAGRRLKDVRYPAWMLLGRTRGVNALRYLSKIREIADPDDRRRSLVRAAIRGGRSGVTEAAAVALRENDAEAWYVVWNAMQVGASLGDDEIQASLGSSQRRIRAITFWNLAMLVGHGVKLPAPMKEVLKTVPEAKLDPKHKPADWSEHEARFSFELLRRAQGEKKHEDLEWARQIPEGNSPWPFPGLHTPVARLLTKGERKILIEKKHYDEDIDQWLDRPLSRGRLREPSRAPRTTLAQFDDFPKGYVTGLVALTGCRDGNLVADVRYHFDSRPESVSLRRREGITSSCAATGRILAASRPFLLYRHWSAVEGRALEPEPEIVEMSLLGDQPLAIAARQESKNAPYPDFGTGGVLRVGGPIPFPKKIRETNIPFPREVLDSGGSVTFEAIIGTDGRVSDVRVLEGRESLAAAVGAAVRNWQYEPTVLDGTPVPVAMMVSMSFSVR